MQEALANAEAVAAEEGSPRRRGEAAAIRGGNGRHGGIVVRCREPGGRNEQRGFRTGSRKLREGEEAS